MQRMHELLTAVEVYPCEFDALLHMLDGLSSYGIHIGPTAFSASFTSTRRLGVLGFFSRQSPRRLGTLPEF
jgi:hypothetical protein